MSLLRSTKNNIDKNSQKPSKRPKPAPKLPGPDRQTKAKKQLAPKPLIGLPVGEFMAQPRPELETLVQKMDILELRSWPEPLWLPQEKPRYFHWGYGLVEEEFRRAWPIVRSALDLAVNFSADLGPSAATRQGILPFSTLLNPAQMETLIAKTLDLVRQSYNGPIGAENYNYYPTGLYEKICEPDYIGYLLNKYDLDLVLDLAHAEVSAHNLKIPIRDYLSQMPWERIKEIHVSRPYIPKQTRALAVDAHWPPQPAQWSLLKWLLKKIPVSNPVIVVECYQSPQIVAQAYEELEELLKSL